MTKQGEIRKVIDAHSDDQCLYLDGVCKFRSNDFKGVYCSSDDGSYKCLMKRLTEIGVVIKVEREPSTYRNEDGEQRYYGDMPYEMYCDGWRRFEPLIEVKDDTGSS